MTTAIISITSIYLIIGLGFVINQYLQYKINLKGFFRFLLIWPLLAYLEYHLWVLQKTVSPIEDYMVSQGWGRFYLDDHNKRIFRLNDDFDTSKKMHLPQRVKMKALKESKKMPKIFKRVDFFSKLLGLKK